MHSASFHGQNTYERRNYEVAVTNGRLRVSISLRPVDQNTGLGCSMSTEEARRFANEVLRRVEQVERDTRTAKVTSK